MSAESEPVLGIDSDKLKEILRNSGILDAVADVLVKDPSLRGQGGGSDRRYVTVKFESCELPPLHLFSKVLIAGNAGHTELIRGVKAFEKETVFLTRYLPAAKEFLKRKGLEENPFLDIYAKCYHSDENMVVLENLVNQGYETVGMDKRHDWDTARIALEAVAKHHALSHAMINDLGGAEKFLERFEPLGEDGFASETWAAKMEPWLQAAIKTNGKLLEVQGSINGDIEGASGALEILNGLERKKGNFWKLWRSCLVTEPGDFKLLNHGDLWYANMMFLQEPPTGSSTPAIKLVDYQVLRYNCPALDLANYLFTSVESSVRQTKLRELLQFYLNRVQKFSSELGYPITADQLNYDLLLLQVRQKFYHGLLNSFGTQYGAARQIAQSVDITKIDFRDWGTVMTGLIDKWIREYPEETRKITEELVSVLEEVANLELAE